MDLSVSEVTIDAGRYFTGIIRDISARKQAEAQLQQSEARYRRLSEELEQRVIRRTQALETANKELDAYSYSVSHDLRAPLRAIHGFGEALLEDYAAQLPAEGQRFLALMRQQTVFMGALIDDLLTLSRANRKMIERSDIQMDELVRTIVTDLQDQEPDRIVNMTIGAMPPAHGDPILIHQVLGNLLANAWKFSQHKETTDIEVSGQVQGDHIVYAVTDHGTGFDMAYVEKLFSPFQRLHSQEEFEGTGIGLALVQRIIHRHGGRAWAEGTVNEGATFYFTLPKASSC